MEKTPQPQNDIKPEEFLTPKQPETLNVSFEYQNEMENALFEKAVRPRLSDEEKVTYDEIATEKYTSDSFLARLIMDSPSKEEKITQEMFDEQTKDAEKYLQGDEKTPSSTNPNHMDEAKKERLEKQMSVFTRAVELMKKYLEEHPKVAKMLFPAIVASELAGCAGVPLYTAQSMIQTGLGGMQQTMQTGMSGYGQARMTEMSGNMQAGQTAQVGSFQAQYTYDSAMQRAGQNRINMYNSLGRPATAEETQRIEAQYQNEVNSASIQARQIAQNMQMEAQRIQMNTQMEAQRIGMNTQMEQYRVGMNVTGEIVRQAIGGIIQGQQQIGNQVFQHLRNQGWNINMR